MRIERCILLSVLVFASTAARAQAQWVATGYLGINVAGDVEAGKGGPGVSVSYFVGGLAFEFDFERYSHFFKDEDVAELLPDPRMDLDTDAMSFMGNVVVPFRLQGTTKLRPYGVAGMGMIRAMFDSTGDQSDTAQNDLGFNLGGGVLYALKSRVGLRSDLRYSRPRRRGCPRWRLLQRLRLMARDHRGHIRVPSVISSALSVGEGRVPDVTGSNPTS